MRGDLEVFVADRLVGVLREDVATGLIDFEYLPEVPDDAAVSLLMPPGVHPDEYRGYNGLPPPFEVSLPEGAILEAIRGRFGKHLDVSSDYDLLRLVGRHTIGRVTFGGKLESDSSLNQMIVASARTEGAAARLASIMEFSPQMFGVSGVMPKMSFGDRGARRPGTWVGTGAIVKFDSENFTGASLVEYACLKACVEAGLQVPKIELGPDMTSLMVERFDIAADGRRLGYEDACALSGIRRTGKYSGTLEHLFDMIRHFVHPDDQAADRQSLLKLIVMNDVLRNGDAHLKNFGLVYDDVARPRLAPVFDVLTTPTWIRFDMPAMALLKSQHGAPDHWLDEQDEAILAGLADVGLDDVHRLRGDLYDAALRGMGAVLRDCPASPQRKALDAAIQIVAEGDPGMGLSLIGIGTPG